MENSDVILKATGLTVGYGRRTVLESVTVECRKGEFWFFIGPNGSGKTTLIRTMLGILRSQAGGLWLHPDLAHRKGIGFVPQRCDLNPALPTTVKEFVILGLVGIQLGAKEEAERLEWALRKVGLEGMAGRDYWSLSGGQRQRALVARALVRRPGLLILDEPTNGLDLSTEDSFLRLLADLNREEHLTLFFVTHDIAIAARYATHLALFRSGSIESGPREQMLNRAVLERVYGVGVEVTRDPSGTVAVQVYPPGGHS
ncbi:MAG: ABC transporter ATP-binding protein [Candidatus Methylomirabilis oxygeniifera]|uniref:ABC transporter, ATPase subunit n=1 Tax=Methylomirabilis oxygeniifera TaxID=671143 RepID=D5MH01_METO1|nr:MAG: ABC transporter ATP-binding protein [Candidatus Methylomirabilis oxyfera]CBE69032.1 ABC transporter, ATPase subunit [Candidatus Methylomirabilis oxyfera]